MALFASLLISHISFTIALLKSAVEVLIGVSEYYSCVIYFLCGMRKGIPHGFCRIYINFSFYGGRKARFITCVIHVFMQ